MTRLRIFALVFALLAAAVVIGASSISLLATAGLVIVVGGVAWIITSEVYIR